MKGLTHLLCIVAGIAGPVLLEGWTTSDSGPRSKAHYAAVVNASSTPRNRAIAFGLQAYGSKQPAAAVQKFFAPNAIDHASGGLTGRDAIAAKAGEIDWLRPDVERKQLHIAGERDLAFVHYGTPAGERVEVYRMKAGQITEHWSVAGAAK